MFRSTVRAVILEKFRLSNGSRRYYRTSRCSLFHGRNPSYSLAMILWSTQFQLLGSVIIGIAKWFRHDTSQTKNARSFNHCALIYLNTHFVILNVLFLTFVIMIFQKESVHYVWSLTAFYLFTFVSMSTNWNIDDFSLFLFKSGWLVIVNEIILNRFKLFDWIFP